MTIKHLGGIFGRNPTFNDVTIDGGIYIGGEASGNYFDDYEQGTWTPSCIWQIRSGSATIYHDSSHMLITQRCWQHGHFAMLYRCKF